jgi:hypothetical protein
MRSTHLLCVPIQPLAEFPISLRWMFNLFLTVFWWKLPTLSMLPFNKLTIATVTFWKIHNVDDLLQKLWRLRPNHCHIQLITQYLHVLLGNDCVFSFSFPIFLHVIAPDVPRLPRFARRCYKSSFGSSLAVLGCEDMIGNQNLALSIGQSHFHFFWLPILSELCFYLSIQTSLSMIGVSNGEATTHVELNSSK